MSSITEIGYSVANTGNVPLPAYNQAAGHCIVVFVTSYTFGGDLGAVPTDTAGNTYVKVFSSDQGSLVSKNVYYAKNCLGNAANIISKATLSTDTYITAYDVAGADLSTPLDVFTSNDNIVNSPSVTITTAQANEAILTQVGYNGTGFGVATQPSGFTLNSESLANIGGRGMGAFFLASSIQTSVLEKWITDQSATMTLVSIKVSATTFSISGNAGVAGATVAWTGTASGSTTADGSGNYTIPSLADGSYTITPTKTGYSFSPTNSSQTVAGADITGVNFTATQILVATPTFSPVAGSYGPAQTVTISSTDSGLSGFAITYTTDGTTPVPGSHGTTYTVPITVSTTQTVKAVASATGYANSATGSAAYTINGALNTPTFSPVAGTYAGAQTVTISSNGIGEAIYWNTTGSPTSGSTLYVGPITVSATETVYAIAEKSGWSNSAVGSAAYTITGGGGGGGGEGRSPIVDSGASDTTRINSPNTSVFGTGGRTRIIG